MNGENLKIVVVDGDGKESSSSLSSESGSSSSGEESSSSSSADSASRASSVWKEDDIGEYLPVTCAENEAKFYKSRFARGSVGRCVRFKGRWITPNEFQAVSGRQSSKDWKRSIRLNGRCLKEYIGEGLFREHPKTCTCGICQGEGTDEDTKRQEGVLALAAKRRRLSQATDGSYVVTGGSTAYHGNNNNSEMSGGREGGTGDDSMDTDGEVEATRVRKLPGTDVKRKRRGRPPKTQQQQQFLSWTEWSPGKGGRNYRGGGVGREGEGRGER